MPYPTATLELTPRELELIENALAETAADCEQFDEHDQCVEYMRLLKRFQRVHSSLINH